MIQITTRRFGPLVVAATANDHDNITFAIGLTVESTHHRLWRVVTR